MATYGLDQLRADIEAKYGSLVFELPEQEPATFLPVMRLPKEKRDRIFALQDVIAARRGEEHANVEVAREIAYSAGNADVATDDGTVAVGLDRLDGMLDALREVFQVVSKGDSAHRLFAALAASDPPLDDDPAALMEIWAQYQEVAMPGEAEPSES